jgi:hypothetical protein
MEDWRRSVALYAAIAGWFAFAGGIIITVHDFVTTQQVPKSFVAFNAFWLVYWFWYRHCSRSSS